MWSIKYNQRYQERQLLLSKVEIAITLQGTTEIF